MVRLAHVKVEVLDVPPPTATVTGASKAPGSPNGIQPHFVGWGRVGVVEVPGPGPAGTPMTLRIFARGDLDSVVGPDYFGLEGINAIEIECRNLLNSITGIDSIQGLRARYLLGDDPDDLVRVNTGIGALGASRINARIIADAFFDGSDLALTLELGHFGAVNAIDTDHFALGTAPGTLAKFQANRFAGKLEFIGPVGAYRLFVGDPQPDAEISGLTGGWVESLVFDSLLTGLTPLVELFALVRSWAVGSYADNFWSTLKDQAQANWLRHVEQWHVHHTLIQGGDEKILKARFLKERGLDIDKAEYLRGVHPKVHDKITNQWKRWQRQEMAAMRLAYPADSERFWRTVDLKVEQCAANIDNSSYSSWWLKPGMTQREAMDIYYKVDTPAKISRFKMGEGSRTAGLFPKVAGALAVFALFEEAAFAKNIVVHPPAADDAWNSLEGHMEGMIEASFTNPRQSDANVRTLHVRARAYLQALGANDSVLNVLTGIFTKWMLDRGIDPL